MGLLGKDGYLRVLTPQTVDGVNLKYDETGSRILKKETHLPLTARKMLEQENEGLPIQLRHKIEVVTEEKPAPIAKAEVKLEDELDEDPGYLYEETDGKEVPQRRKPGPKPKERIA